jgi:GTP-binding protein
MLFKQARQRVSTADLNRVLRAAIERNPPPLYKHRTPKIYYATQVGVEPPTLVLFCNNPQAVSANYRRYLLGVFRDFLPFGEVPIKLYLRRREGAVPSAAGEARTETEGAASPQELAEQDGRDLPQDADEVNL